MAPLHVFSALCFAVLLTCSLSPASANSRKSGVKKSGKNSKPAPAPPPSPLMSALLSLKASLDPTGTKLTDWKFTYDHKKSDAVVCNWQGVHCTRTYTGGPPVSAISLSNKGLTGTIPAQISALTNLKSLDLSKNRLKGTIPPQLASLQLKTLHLNDNAFSSASDSTIKFICSRSDFNIFNTCLPSSSLKSLCPKGESCYAGVCDSTKTASTSKCPM